MSISAGILILVIGALLLPLLGFWTIPAVIALAVGYEQAHRLYERMVVIWRRNRPPRE